MKLPKPASKYLRPDDVEDGSTVQITGHLVTIPAEETKYGRERHVIPIKLEDDTEKQWGLNQTSYRTLYDAFGDDGDNWINKLVKVVKNREKVRGNTLYVLYAEPSNKTPTKQASLPVNEEALAKLSPEEKQRLIKKLNMQQ